MNKDKKEKIKKKKMVTKEAIEGDSKEASGEPLSNKTEVMPARKEDSKGKSKPEMDSRSVFGQENVKQNTLGIFSSKKENPEEKAKSRQIPDGFYIAHPRSIKKATQCFQDVHSRKLAELLEAFHMFDFDRDGVINRDDLKKIFASLNRNNVEDEEIDQMLSEGLNPLNFDAFVILLGYKTLDLDPEEVFLDALSNWDDHHEGLVSHERLLHDLMAWGDRFTEEEAASALADAPIVFTKTKEKMIDYVQFSEDLCGLRKMMQRKQPNKTEA